MAAQTHGAVDSLLSLLSSAIKDEAVLLGGVHGDVQFIKDEMDSMNGFLMHLTKTEGEHNDQLRAWMKQVRDIAYIAEDCIELYMRDLARPDEGFLAFLRHLPVYIYTCPARHRLGKQIRELKDRVREVGERRLRYGVNVPDTGIKQVPKPTGQDGSAEEAREKFLQALEEDLVVVLRSGHQLAREEAGTTDCPSFSKAISLLPALLSEGDTRKKISDILEHCNPEFSCMKMFLCALRVYPYATVQLVRELENLHSKLELGEEDEPKEQVRIFCYSKLSTQQKSCLQYLTAFIQERSIARTSLVRRWVAEGLVAKDGEVTAEEVGERCFGELVFRGFVQPFSVSDTGTVKSCVLDDSTRKFIIRIAKSENFVSELPSHLKRQIQIRKIVLRPPPQQQEADRWKNIPDLCCCGGGGGGGGGSSSEVVPPGDRDSTTASDFKEPMDELVHFLKSLPEVYRLNVLDLGGCQGLKERHIRSICRVASLKYLSLRKTNVTRLPARHIQKLRLLETLDIRDTDVRAADMKHIFLPKLKHLLAGRNTGGGGGDGGEEESLSTVEVPRRIGTMRYMETLYQIQVSDSGTELDGVAKLPRLRKLGMVIPVNMNTTKHLRRVISMVGVSLRSLSIWAVTNGSQTDALDLSMEEGVNPAFSPSSMVLENLDIKGKCFLPRWLALVQKLPNITLRDTDMKGDLLATLANVQGLRCLRLLHGSYTDHDSLNFVKGGQFKALKILVVEGNKIASITFEDRSAAPKLEKIVWTIIRMDKLEKDLISGLDQLPSLKEIELRGRDFEPTELSGLKEAMANHPNKPTLRYMSRGKLFEGDVTVTAE